MKRSIGFLLSTLLLLVVGVQGAQAQASIQIGPRAGFEFSEGRFGDLFVGADARIGLIGLPVLINPAFDYYLEKDNVKGWQLSGNVLLPFGIENQVFTPYAGAGIAVTNTSGDADIDLPDGGLNIDESNTDIGLNLIFGAQFGVGSLRPFAQVQYTVGGDVNPGWIGGGLLFNLGG